MCGIFGWFGEIPTEWKRHVLDRVTDRGRDGFGFWADGREHRYLPQDLHEGKQALLNDAFEGKALCVVGNARATPTTEQETRREWLQPYHGLVHNGTIANDADLAVVWGQEPPRIDSMILPKHLSGAGEQIKLPMDLKVLRMTLEAVQGSYALAYYAGPDVARHLILAANYKPLYYWRGKRAMLFASTREMIPLDAVAVRPYTARRFMVRDPYIESEMSLWSPRERPNGPCLVACSGGLDSVTAAYMLRDQGYEVTLAHFGYGCLADEREVCAVQDIADAGRFDLVLMDMPQEARLYPLGLPRHIMRGTIIRGEYHRKGVEGAEYAHDWVSARNLLMLSMLTAYAEANDFEAIAFGGNLEESGAYPDNEEEFAARFRDLLPYSTQANRRIDLIAPVARMMKHEIVREGLRLRVPFELTWSCYGDGMGGAKCFTGATPEGHCGECGPCYMRRTAFERNGLVDPVFEGIKT